MNPRNDGFVPRTKERSDTFIYVGAVTVNKGVTDLIKAYSQYKHMRGRMNLLIIGQCKTEYEIELKKELKANGISESVRFVGLIENVSDYFKEAKAIIVPSFNEAFGRITAEAMSFGCLVIGRNTAGTKMQFDLGKKVSGNEIGLRFNSISDLVSQMILVSEMGKEEYERFTNNARDVVEELYSVEKNVELTYDYFKKISESTKNSDLYTK